MPVKQGQKPLKQLKPGMGLYQVFYWPNKAPDKSKPWAVANLETGDVNGRWHSNKADASKQARALYATLGDKAKVHSDISGVIIPVKNFSDAESWVDGNKLWIKKYPYSTWTHPLFTDTTITPEIGEKMVKNFHDKVFGDKDLLVNYDHGKDQAKGGKAAGWIREMELREDGIYELVEFTDIAKKEIEDGEWRYYSGSHFDSWTHPQRGETFEFVPNGGALTNQPYVRDGILPLNFSEVFVEREGDPNGTVDLEAQMAEDVVDEHAGQEHADPGQDERLDERNDDDAADTGSRVDTPPDTEDTVDVSKIRGFLGLDESGSIEDAIEQLVAEVAPLREAAKNHSDAKTFSEMFPEQAEKMKKLEQRDKDARAKEFSESFATVRDSDGNDTNKGFSTVVIDKIKELHKEFSDRTATIDSVGEILNMIASGDHIVEFGERGANRNNEDSKNFSDDPAKAFSEAVSEKMSKDELDIKAATKLVVEQSPELYEAYQRSLPGRR